MTDNSENRPVTLADLRAVLAEMHLATKDDLKNFATKDDLKKFATKKDLEQFVTKVEFNKLEQTVSRLVSAVIDLKVKQEEMATRQEVAEFREEVLKKLDDSACTYLELEKKYTFMYGKTETLALLAVNHDSDIERLKERTGIVNLPPAVTKDREASGQISRIRTRMTGELGVRERRAKYGRNNKKRQCRGR